MSGEPREVSGPLVSVVLPTYQRPRLLRRAIASVVDQRYRNFELVVVDDGSDPSVLGVVESFDDPRVRYHRHEQNRGNAAARNTGIRLAEGDYLAFLDDDDEWHRDKLARQVPLIVDSPADVGLVYCGRQVMRNGRLVRTERATRTGDVFDYQLVHGMLPCPTVLAKTGVVRDAGGFDESLDRGVDSDLWRRIARDYRILSVPDVLVVCHEGHARISDFDGEDSVRAAIRSQEAKLKKFGRELEERPVQHAKILRQIARRQIQLGELEPARHRLRRAIGRAPEAILLRLELLALHGGVPVYRAFRWLLSVATTIRRRLRQLSLWESGEDGARPFAELRPDRER